ncbi:glycosyltransferase [uncultured Parabacteroides sp.]|uniref:glycosyltransferase family 2 protein n=1 Tax=uncultured Parabacteroides sp. TaxID=512312 RepID=UPI002634709F|nr:glycosyltransferase [uncultured Parabacteroides sp.]
MKVVSVVMPVYNMEKYVAESVDSILNQTFSGWELIIVDDGSTDGTAEILRSFTDSRIRVLANFRNKLILDDCLFCIYYVDRLSLFLYY